MFHPQRSTVSLEYLFLWGTLLFQKAPRTLLSSSSTRAYLLETHLCNFNVHMVAKLLRRILRRPQRKRQRPWAIHIILFRATLAFTVLSSIFSLSSAIPDPCRLSSSSYPPIRQLNHQQTQQCHQPLLLREPNLQRSWMLAFSSSSSSSSSSSFRRVSIRDLGDVNFYSLRKSYVFF